jgi:hypothetical protein
LQKNKIKNHIKFNTIVIAAIWSQSQEALYSQSSYTFAVVVVVVETGFSAIYVALID